MVALTDRVVDLTNRLGQLEHFRDGDGELGAAAKIHNLEKCTNGHTDNIADLTKWKNEIVMPFISKANGLMVFMGVLGSAVLVAIVGLIVSILTHEVTIVR